MESWILGVFAALLMGAPLAANPMIIVSGCILPATPPIIKSQIKYTNGLRSFAGLSQLAIDIRRMKPMRKYARGLIPKRKANPIKRPDLMPSNRVGYGLFTICFGEKSCRKGQSPKDHRRLGYFAPPGSNEFARRASEIALAQCKTLKTALTRAC